MQSLGDSRPRRVFESGRHSRMVQGTFRGSSPFMDRSSGEPADSTPDLPGFRPPAEEAVRSGGASLSLPAPRGSEARDCAFPISGYIFLLMRSFSALSLDLVLGRQLVSQPCFPPSNSPPSPMVSFPSPS